MLFPEQYALVAKPLAGIGNPIEKGLPVGVGNRDQQVFYLDPVFSDDINLIDGCLTGCFLLI